MFVIHERKLGLHFPRIVLKSALVVRCLPDMKKKILVEGN